MKTSISNITAITGYVTPQQFGPFTMPVPAQNSCLREYANTMGFSYNMPQCEHIFPNCYMQLFSTLTSIAEDGHIVMYSFHMMPKSQKNMDKLLEIQKQKNLTFHYVLEKKIVKTAEEINEMFKILRIAEMIKENNLLREKFKNFIKN